MSKGKRSLMQRIEDWMNPPEGTEIGVFYRIALVLAWIAYGILWVVLALLALGVLLAFIAYGVPGTEV